MRSWGRMGAAAIMGALLASPVAADGPQKWTGLYVGVHGGYAWGEWSGNMIYTDANKYPGFDAGAKTIDAEGALAGGQIGFNVQSGNFVWGIEGDVSWSDIGGSARLLPYPVNYPANGSPAWEFNSRIEWLATVRARLGITAGSALLYATGGVAFGEVGSTLDVVGPGYDAWGQKNETRTGFTVGGGMEWMLASKWTLKAEYLYVNLGEVGGILPGAQKTSCSPTACPHTTDGFGGDLDLHTMRLGLNYNLN